MKVSRIARSLLALAIVAAAGSAQAGLIFHATLTNDQEVTAPNPPIPNEGTSGVATFTLNDAMTRLTYNVVLTGLDLRGVDPATGTPGLVIPGDLDPNNNVTRMHIHRNFVGSNGNIVFGMIDANPLLRNDSNPNDLFIDVQGLHITGAWDLNEGSQVVGQETNLANELANLLAEGLYINVHTSDHPGGEIRGQITVPAPATLALVGLGLLGLGATRRRSS